MARTVRIRSEARGEIRNNGRRRWSGGSGHPWQGTDRLRCARSRNAGHRSASMFCAGCSSAVSRRPSSSTPARAATTAAFRPCGLAHTDSSTNRNPSSASFRKSKTLSRAGAWSKELRSSAVAIRWRDSADRRQCADSSASCAIARVAPVPSNVLIVGESGSGKELVARELHRLGSGREDPTGRSEQRGVARATRRK